MSIPSEITVPVLYCSKNIHTIRGDLDKFHLTSRKDAHTYGKLRCIDDPWFSQHLLAISSKSQDSPCRLGYFNISNLAGVNNISDGPPPLHTAVINSNALVSVLQASKVMVGHNSLSSISLIITRKEPEGFKSKEMKMLIALLRSGHAKYVY